MYSILGVGFGIGCVISLSRRDWFDATSIGGLSLGMLAELLQYVRSGILSSRDAGWSGLLVRNGGLYIPREFRTKVLDLGSYGFSGVGFPLIAFGIWSGQLEEWILDPGATFVYAPAAVLLGILALWKLGQVVLHSEGALWIGPDGIRSNGGEVICWNRMTFVRPAPIVGDRRPGRWISFRFGDRADQFRVDQLSCGSTRALWLIDFYFGHPNMRRELSSADVLRRLSDEDLISDLDKFSH